MRQPTAWRPCQQYKLQRALQAAYVCLIVMTAVGSPMAREMRAIGRPNFQRYPGACNRGARPQFLASDKSQHDVSSAASHSRRAGSLSTSRRSWAAPAGRTNGSTNADDLENDRQQQQQQQQRRRRAKKSGQRRQDFQFFIARSDLTFAQPWWFEQTSPLADLQLRAQGVLGLDDNAAASASRQATARFKVELPTGLSVLVVTGHVDADIPLRCELCGEAFEACLDAVPFDAVLLLEAGSAAAAGNGGGVQPDLAANEIVFRLDDSLCDLTPIITDAMLTSLPSVCLCGGGSCKQHAGQEVTWRSSPSAPSSSPFAAAFGKKRQLQRRKVASHSST